MHKIADNPQTRSSGQSDSVKAARSSGILSRLSAPIVDEVLKGGQRGAYPTGSIIPSWDERPWMAVVLSGCLRVFLTSADGGQVTLRYLRAGDFIGTFYAYPASLSRNVLVLQRAELFHLDVSRLTALTQKEPAVAWEFLRETTRVLNLVNRSYGIRTFGSVRLRVANAILERAEACGGAKKGTVVTGTQQEFATAAGTVREVVAPALHAMNREGIIGIQRGAIVILDPERLASDADGTLGLSSAF